MQRFLVFWRRNIEFLMRRPFSTSDGILFQIVGSAKEAVSIPYLTVRTLQYLNLVSFLSEYGFPTVRKIFFITSGTTFIFNFKISTANFLQISMMNPKRVIFDQQVIKRGNVVFMKYF